VKGGNRSGARKEAKLLVVEDDVMIRMVLADIRYRGQGPASCRLAGRGEVSYLVPRSEEIDLK
jgi:hypothetical protein